MAHGGFRLVGFVRKNPAEEGVGQALRDAFQINEGDAHEVRRMEQLIEKLKQIEGDGE